MTTKEYVLGELLKTEDYVSGEKIARSLKVSRAAVAKAIHSLKKDGYKIEAKTNNGYKLLENSNIISASSISNFLKNNIEVIHLKSVDSTNNEAKRLCSQGKNNVFLVVSDSQTAGRGRQGKSFYSPNQTGIYFSLVIHPKISLKNPVTITTAASVAVSKSIENLTSVTPSIKWVNDVYVQEKKICGILTEAISDFEAQTIESIIVGIGVNISTQKFPSNIQNAGSLNVDVNKNELIANICDELLSMVTSDFQSFIDYYRTHSNVIHQNVIFIENNLKREAYVESIDELGGLVVKLPNGERKTLRSGEISIRKI